MNALSRIRRYGLMGLMGLVGLSVAHPVQAHPMGNFSICRYTHIHVEKDRLYLRYILDMAEIPTVGEKESLDLNRDGKIDPDEKAAYLAAKAPELRAGLSLTVRGKPAPLTLKTSDLKILPGAGGLETLKIKLDWETPLPKASASCRVVYRDRNYKGRTGWKEVIATGGQSASLRDSTVPSTDLSQELSVYPPGAIPLQRTEARFTLVPTGMPAPTGYGPLPVRSANSGALEQSGGGTPRDAFTQIITRKELTPGLMLAGLLIAFMFGALHALSPGHGKAMVAAYLVGSRGTPGHAVILGLTVTITHTLGVFLLGLVTLAASRYIVPERLYPVLNILSGLAVCFVGLWLLYCRIRGISSGHHPHHHSQDDHHHTHDHHHGHAHEHTHHLPEGPVTIRALLALGISGGMVPCPSALVVLLSAAALHRIAYGLLLISAFSIGLASVLVGLGLMVLSARQWLSRLPSGGPLLRRLPIASAAVITLVGIGLIVRALEQGMP